jgi:hypothetical protein
MLYKLQQTKEVLGAKGEQAALRFAAKIGCLGAYRDRIQKGASALSHPGLYRDMGMDPDALVADGLAALGDLLREAASADDVGRCRTVTRREVGP